MKKISVLLFGMGLLGISFYGLSNNSYYVQLLINISIFIIYARISLVAVLLVCAFVPSMRLYTTRALLGLGGTLLFVLGVISVGSPLLLGHINANILIGDTLILIEGGILAVVLSAELSARRSRYMVRGFAYIHSLFVTPTIKLERLTILQPAILLMAQIQFKPVLSVDKVIPTFEV